MLLPYRPPGALVAPQRRSSSNSNSSSSCNHRPAVCAAAGNSPWASQPDKRKGSGSSGQNKGKPSRDSKKGKGSSKGGRDGAKNAAQKPAKKQPKSSSSGQGFGPKQQAQPPVQTYKITPPLTPQLLDELSSWETAAAPLWGTFCGHCEGEWLGQYSAYTPWGGDPEPVWADESGAYLTHAFCRVSEERQSLPAVPPAGSAGEDKQQQQQQQQEEGGEMLDLLVRTTQRSASIASLIGGVSAAAAAAEAAGAAASSSPSTAAAEAAGVTPVTAASSQASDAAEDEDLEALGFNTSGSVVFNGGSYSLGPEVIEVPDLDDNTVEDYYDALEAAAAAAAAGGADGEEDDGEGDPLSALPYSTVVVEQALVTGGDKRLRLVATLKVRRPPGQEMDIEIARLLLYKEFWYGTSDSTSSSSSSGGGSRRLQLLPSHSFEVPCTQQPRPQPASLAGTWNVFVIAANPAVEENPNTLQDETVVLYSSREERQHWHVPTITSSASPTASSSSSTVTQSAAGNGNGAAMSAQQQQSAVLEEEGDDDSGGSWWLPGGALVSVRMVTNSSSSSAGGEDGTASGSSSSNGSSREKPHRGLVVGLHLMDGSGSCLFVEREYGPDGVLAEVRQGTAVKGGWSGGRM